MAEVKPEDIEVEEEPLGGCDVCMPAGRPTKEYLIGNYDWKWLCLCLPPWTKGLKPPPLFKKDDKLPILVALVMGFQHAIAMLGGLVTPPLLIAGDGCLFNRDAELCAARSYMISSALITSGLLTIIQVIRFRLFKGYYLGTGLVSVMGTSFTFLPVARAITTSEFGSGGCGGKCGYGKFLGTVLVASLLEICLSFIPRPTLRKLFPPIVTGTCVCLIGASLSGTGMKYWGGGVFCADNTITRSAPWHINSRLNGPQADSWPGSPGPQHCAGGDNGDAELTFGDARYVGAGFLVLLSMVVFRTFGSPFIKNVSGVLALLFVYLISISFSANDRNFVTTTDIENAKAITFNWATTFKLGFSSQGFLPILIGFVVSSIESIGDIEATLDASGMDTEGPDASSRIQGGLLADGVNSFLAALMTSPPNTTFSQNNGVIVMTRCASRGAALACAGWLIFMGMIGKISGLIISIPQCVLGGYVTFMFSSVFISGIAILSKVDLGVKSKWGTGSVHNSGGAQRNRFILAISLGTGLGVAIQPNFFDPAPGAPAAFYGVDLAHKIGFWPLDNVCKTFPTTTITDSPATCIWSDPNATSGVTLNLGLGSDDCALVGNTVYTPAVTRTVSKETQPDCFPSFGSASNCCLEYHDGALSFRAAILILLNTPYCIGTLLALFLNLVLPYESDPDEESDVKVTKAANTSTTSGMEGMSAVSSS